MPGTSSILLELGRKGYSQNIIPCFDHFSVNSGETKLFPHEFRVDEVYRVENTSDPDDQSILFAISSEHFGVKGVYVDSYGPYHDDLSPELLAALCCPRSETPKIPSPLAFRATGS